MVTSSLIDVGPCPPGKMLCSNLESSTGSHMEGLIGWAIDLGSFGCEVRNGQLGSEGFVNHRIDLQWSPIRILGSRVGAEIPSACRTRELNRLARLVRLYLIFRESGLSELQPLDQR